MLKQDFSREEFTDRFARVRASLAAAKLLLGQCGIEVQHKRVGVGTEFRHDEGDALGHQAGNERHVAREAVELGDQHRAFVLARCDQRCCKLRPAINRIRPYRSRSG